MRRLPAFGSGAALVALGLVLVGIAGCGSGEDPGDRAARSAQDPRQGPSGPLATIYFPAASGLLEAEMRPAPADLDRASRNLWLAEQIVAGPETGALKPALPAGTTVAGVFSDPRGTVFVDFALPDQTAGMGSRDEMLSLYSVINTILLDDGAAERVVILLNGRQRETLAGHVDTSRPLTARTDLIRQAG